MKVTSTTVSLYALLILLGGLMGYVKGGSTLSLLFGTAFGLPLLFSAYWILKGSKTAQVVALVLTLCLDALFTYRFAKTLHFFPSGLFSVLSLAVLIVIALKIRKTARA